jgi:hypothetical protein
MTGPKKQVQQKSYESGFSHYHQALEVFALRKVDGHGVVWSVTYALSDIAVDPCIWTSPASIDNHYCQN